MSKATFCVSVVEDPARIRERYPDGAPWKSNITPRVYVMMDGDPYNDPESGVFVVPRVRDPRFTRSAALIALYPEVLAQLRAPHEAHETLQAALGITLFPNREEAFIAHPELSWNLLGVIAGVDF